MTAHTALQLLQQPLPPPLRIGATCRQTVREISQSTQHAATGKCSFRGKYNLDANAKKYKQRNVKYLDINLGKNHSTEDLASIFMFSFLFPVFPMQDFLSVNGRPIE